MGDTRIDDAVDVVEGEVGSARLKEPAQVEAEGGRPDAVTLPGASDDRQDLPDDDAGGGGNPPG